MTFDLDVGGCRRSVTVAQADRSGTSRLSVVIRDPETGREESLAVDARATASGLSWVYADDHRSVDAVVSRTVDGTYLVDLPHAAVAARIDRHGRRAGGATGTDISEQRVTAPLPGRVVRVLVAVGGEVSPRQDLVVIEAMKMENALQSTRAGRVLEVHVSAGVSVEAGRLLVVIAPLE